MKSRKIKDMLRAKQQIERGAVAPASIWRLSPDGKGGLTRTALDPKAFQRAQKAAWEERIAAARR